MTALAAVLVTGAASAAVELSVTSCTILDDCYCHDADRAVDPGELLVVNLTIANSGSSAADLVGVISLAEGGEPISGLGAFGPLAIAAGGSRILSVYVLATAKCGDLVKLVLTDLETGSGPHSDILDGCELVVGGPSTDECLPCCETEDVDPIEPIFGVKAAGAPGDVLLSWNADPAPFASHYNTYFVTGAGNKAKISETHAGGPWPTAPACTIEDDKQCRHVGAAHGPGGEIFFYQVRGLCVDEEAVE